jgi:hypothetical protein
VRLTDLAGIFKHLVKRKSRNKFVIDSPKSGVNSLMASRYLESFAGLIGDGELLLNGSKGFHIFVGSIEGRHVEAQGHSEAILGVTNRRLIIVYDKDAIAPKEFELREICDYLIKDCEGDPFLIKDLVFVTREGSVICFRGGELFSLEVGKLFEELKILPK